MKRRGIRAALAVTLAMAVVLASAALLAASHVTIVVDGRTITSDVPPFMQGDRVFIPIRFVSEALGAGVEWNQATRTVTITSGAAAGRPLTLLGSDPNAAYPAPVGQVQGGITFIVESITRTGTGTVVRLRLKNGSNTTVVYNADTRIWIGNTYYQALTTGQTLLGNILPGGERTGSVSFGGVQAGVALKVTGSFSVPGQTPASLEVNVSP